MKRIITTFRKYEGTFTGATEAFNSTKEKLKHEYGSSRAFEQKFSEAKRIYDETIATAKQEALDEIRSIFADLNEKVQNFVQQPAPADFVQTFEAIKALGKDVTKSEAKMYFDMYRENYLAARSLSTYMYSLKGYLMPIPAVDFIQEELACHEHEAVEFIRNFTGASYISALFTTNKNNPWEACGEKFEAFLNGNVEVMAEQPEKYDEFAAELERINANTR